MGTARKFTDVEQYFEYAAHGIEVIEDGLQMVPFGEYLIEQEVLTREQLFRALSAQDRRPSVPLGEIVAELGFMPAPVVEGFLAEFQAVHAVELA